MKVDELKRILRNNKVPHYLYTFNKDYDDEKLCLNKTLMGWEVYHCERGEKNDTKLFNNEDDACEYMLERLLNIKKNI